MENQHYKDNLSNLEQKIEKEINLFEEDYKEKKSKVKEFEKIEENFKTYMKNLPDKKKELKNIEELKKFQEQYAERVQKLEKLDQTFQRQIDQQNREFQ